MNQSYLSRRDLLSFFGKGIALSASSQLLSSCGHLIPQNNIPCLHPMITDNLELASGLKYDVLIKAGDKISNNHHFGYNNDYTASIPLNKNEILLWVNHESVKPLFTSGWMKGQVHTKDQIKREQYEVGGSILHLKKVNSKWKLVHNSKYNRRLTANSKIPFSNNYKIQGSKFAMGTLANCAGGTTPWDTVLTCEENYNKFFGEIYFENGQRKVDPHLALWLPQDPRPPEHYGWVCEVNLKSGNSKKLIPLGRFAHECANTTRAKDGRVVVYMGDDKEDEFIYKFVSDAKDNLKSGTLYVANTEMGKWLALDRKNPILKKRFKSQLELLIHTREAAKILGATPQARPEDVEIHPATKDVYVCLTNSYKKKNYYGSILKIKENNADPASLEFTTETFASGGKESGFVCPDNICFDKSGNIWLTIDISEKTINEGPYKGFGNNALFFIPTSGKYAGVSFQMASAPLDAELTGPHFTPDGSLILSVQHPGARTTDPNKPTSHWPEGGNSQPKPSVVVITGPTLEKLTNNLY